VVDLIEPPGLIESLSSSLNDEVDGLSNAIDAMSNDFGAHIGALSNDFGSHIGELEVGFGALETWRATADPKILTLQEFDLVFYYDLRKLHDEINAVAENASNARAALSNDLGEGIGALSNELHKIGNINDP
jgi:hypothetical protein